MISSRRWRDRHVSWRATLLGLLRSDLFHDEYQYRTPGEKLVGADGLRGLFAKFHTAVPELEVQVDDVFGKGDYVATALTLRGTHSGELRGISLAGRQVSVHGTTHSRVRGGRIV